MDLLNNGKKFYFCPIILNLPRQIDLYDPSKFKCRKEIEDEKKAKEWPNCTREFAKNVIFNRVRQLRINAIKEIIERKQCKRKMDERKEMEEYAYMPYSDEVKEEEEVLTPKKSRSRSKSTLSRKKSGSNLAVTEEIVEETVVETEYVDEDGNVVQPTEEDLNLIDLEEKPEEEEEK